MVDARTVRFAAADLPTVLDGVKSVVACKGKKVATFDLTKDYESEELEKHLIGPSGNLRAPTLRRGKNLFVGFNADALANFVS